MGCRSVYRFHCISYPTGAGVTIAEEMVGVTECDVEVPKDSPWIQDGKVEFTFHLPEEQATPGQVREKKRVVDLAGLKPSNPLADIISLPLIVAGVGLIWVAGETLKDDEDDPEKDRDVGEGLGIGLLGVGLVAAGIGAHWLCGGDSDSLTPRKVRADFDEPAVAPAQP